MKIFLRENKHAYYEAIDVDDIVLMEASSNYTTIFTKTKNYVYSITMGDIYPMFQVVDEDHSLIRIHRSIVVNKKHVTGINGNELRVNGKWYTVAKSHREEIFRNFVIL